MITITAYDWVPDFARGFVRDIRVRWALEEAGLPYRTRIVSHTENKEEPYLKLQPFAQVPVFEEDGFHMFESGAICLHLAKRSDALFPSDDAGQARATQWVFAALNSMEPFIFAVQDIHLFHPEAEWANARLPSVTEALERRLARLAHWLRDREWLEDRFTVGDLTMAAALRSVDFNDMVVGDPVLGPYLERCLERPAFKKALAAQLSDLSGSPPQA